MIKKLRDHIERWNIWRKHNMNGPVHKILVLLKVFSSPSFEHTVLPREWISIEDEIERINSHD